MRCVLAEVSGALDTLTCMSRNAAEEAARFVGPLLSSMKTTMLTTQYRMHPFIAEWPSASFYRGNLVSGVKEEERVPPPGIQWQIDISRTEHPSLSDSAKAAPVLFVKVIHT